MLLMKLVWSKDSAKMPTIVPRAPKPMTSMRTATTTSRGCSIGAPVTGMAAAVIAAPISRARKAPPTR